jgi:hypothetical protein
VADVVLCQSISADGSTSKRLVIMDEVDGMGGSDRGGIPELIKVLTVVSLFLYVFQYLPLSPPKPLTQALYLFLSFSLLPTHALSHTNFNSPCLSRNKLYSHSNANCN